MNGRINLTKLKRGNRNLSLERCITFAFKDQYKTVDRRFAFKGSDLSDPVPLCGLRVQGFDKSSPSQRNNTSKARLHKAGISKTKTASPTIMESMVDF